MDKIFLLNFVPDVCPSCYMSLKMEDSESLYDFFGSASHTCPGCGAKYCFVRNEQLLTAADSMGSDLSARLKGN